MPNLITMTYMDDLLVLKEARIVALTKELASLKEEIEYLRASKEINDNLLTQIYNENK